MRPLLLSALLGLAALPAQARKAPAPTAPAGARASAAPDKRQQERRGKRAIRLDAVTVQGRIQKPQAFYILQRSQLDFDELSRAETFVPKVLQSVEKEPL